jgi:hypothetical protein
MGPIAMTSSNIPISLIFTMPIELLHGSTITLDCAWDSDFFRIRALSRHRRHLKKFSRNILFPTQFGQIMEKIRKECSKSFERARDALYSFIPLQSAAKREI